VSEVIDFIKKVSAEDRAAHFGVGSFEGVDEDLYRTR
jgi:hypothetical protein